MKNKLIITIIISVFIFISSANAEIVKKNMESIILMDVGRRYYKVSEIENVIDTLSQNENSSLILHFTDDENVGIECDYLNQTKENAIKKDDIYINPNTNKEFLTYDEVNEIKEYAKNKNVRLIPEIDVPAHMKGFFDLAEIKFGTEYVRAKSTGIAWGNDSELGNIDLMNPEAKKFIYNLYDEYTNFFQDCEYFSIGFDEYTFRPELKVSFINELSEYLFNKNFKVRMWSDSITKNNIKDINNNIEIMYWGNKNNTVIDTEYATPIDLVENNFKVLITNKYYLFYVPTSTNISDEDVKEIIKKINNNWNLSKWDYTFTGEEIESNYIIGGIVALWSESSTGVDGMTITNNIGKIYQAMFNKLPKIIIEVEDNISEEETNNVENPKTSNNIIKYVIIFSLTLIIQFIILINKKQKYLNN